jgi:hypothetical protein
MYRDKSRRTPKSRSALNSKKIRSPKVRPNYGSKAIERSPKVHVNSGSSKARERSRSKPRFHVSSRETSSDAEMLSRQYCERNADGVRRCEPEEQYKERTGRGRRKEHGRRLNESEPVRNSSVLKHVVKRGGRRRDREMDSQSRIAVAKRVDEWLVHQDIAEPLERFSSLRFSDTNAVQNKFGRRPITVERDTIGTHYDVNFEDVSDMSSSSGDYSSSDGTSASDVSSSEDESF